MVFFGCDITYPVIQMEFILFGVAVQLGNLIWMRIGVTVHKVQVRAFQIASILNGFNGDEKKNMNNFTSRALEFPRYGEKVSMALSGNGGGIRMKSNTYIWITPSRIIITILQKSYSIVNHKIIYAIIHFCCLCLPRVVFSLFALLLLLYTNFELQSKQKQQQQPEKHTKNLPWPVSAVDFANSIVNS